jgi:CheY-like chemotaxis protein
MAIRSLGFVNVIVGLTGNALDDDVAEFIASGVDGVFTKPFRDDQLKGLLSLLEREGFKSSPDIRDVLSVMTGLNRR